ncbi:DUF933 domain-containing protein, partial [Candidatus Curtissbacteria bacterium]|nr:DUF933 domain-containing protein [Candidatus Curtissbacteria bacterium]
VITKRYDGMAREYKIKPAADPAHAVFNALETAKRLIEEGKWLVDVMDVESLERIKDLQLLSTKKVIYVINSDEGDLGKEPPIAGGVRISARLEEEIGGLAEDEQKEYMQELGVTKSGLSILITKAYETLGLITFLTAGPKEVRAWTIYKGTLAPQAAGVIHTDFERGFIAAEVVDWKALVDAGGWTAAKSKGLIKTIGKTEEIKDGMVVEFRFSV